MIVEWCELGELIFLDFYSMKFGDAGESNGVKSGERFLWSFWLMFTGFY